MTRHYTHWDMPLPGGTIAWSAQGGRLPLVAYASDKLNGEYVRWAYAAVRLLLDLGLLRCRNGTARDLG